MGFMNLFKKESKEEQQRGKDFDEMLKATKKRQSELNEEKRLFSKAQRQYEVEEAQEAELRILRRKAEKAEASAGRLRETRQLRQRISTARTERFKPLAAKLSGFTKSLSKPLKQSARISRHKPKRRANKAYKRQRTGSSRIQSFNFIGSSSSKGKNKGYSGFI